VAGRFKLITDEHFSKSRVKAAKDSGWEVVRVVDVLGQRTPDEDVMAYCAEHGYVWVTSDERAQGKVIHWINSGKTLPGVIVVAQRHRRRITPGRFLRFLESLAAEDEPFGCVIRHVGPEEK